MPSGWPLLLATLLLVWQPLTFAFELLATLPTLGMRGVLGVVELAAHGLVAALSFAAGWALWGSNPAAPPLATAALVAAAVSGVQSLYYSVLPSQVFPSDRLAIAALTVAHASAWILYLRLSKKVRALQDR